MRRVRPPGIEPNSYTAAEKRALAYQLKPITDAEATADFRKLRAYDHYALNLSLIGNKAVDRFTYAERLDTTGSKGLSFFDLFAGRAAFDDAKYVQQTILYVHNRTTKPKPECVAWRYVMDLYFGSIKIFRPLVAASIYTRFSPECVLDPTMGWGGRLVGAMALDVPHYIGIDNNLALERPYSEMVELFAPLTKTKATLLFKSALDVDYSLLDYDMVLTSPPYYNVECYGDAREPYASTEAWDADFYTPLFRRTYDGMRDGGRYCLNIPESIYERVCVPLFGPAHIFIELKKVKRRACKYGEFVYVWAKGSPAFDSLPKQTRPYMEEPEATPAPAPHKAEEVRSRARQRRP